MTDERTKINHSLSEIRKAAERAQFYNTTGGPLSFYRFEVKRLAKRSVRLWLSSLRTKVFK